MDKYWSKYYDSTSGYGEIPEVDRKVLLKLYPKIVEHVVDKERQLKGIDYIVENSHGCKLNIDIKDDHYDSRGDFVFETRDGWGYSWTMPGFHETDYICWIKHSEGRAYFISYKWLTEDFVKTETFLKRQEQPMGNRTYGKFFRLGSEIKYARYVPFDQLATVVLKHAKSDDMKYIDEY